MNVMTALVLAFTLGLGLASLNSDASEKRSTGFSGNHRPYDQCGNSPLASALYLRYLLEYDSFGTGVLHSDGIYQDYRSHFHFAYLPAGLSVFYRSAVCTQKSVKLLGKMMPVYFTALGTQSSAATIPVTLEQTKKNGVSADIAGFVIPLCATNPSVGSTLKIVAYALH